MSTRKEVHKWNKGKRPRGWMSAAERELRRSIGDSGDVVSFDLKSDRLRAVRSYVKIADVDWDDKESRDAAISEILDGVRMALDQLSSGSPERWSAKR